MDGWVFHGVSAVGSFRSGSSTAAWDGMHLVVHEESGFQEFNKNLLEVIAAVDAPLSLTLSSGDRSLRNLTFAPQNLTTSPSLDRTFRENTPEAPFGC